MNNMTPEQIQAILAAGGDDPEAASLQRQQSMADMMRQRAVGGTGPDKMAGGLVVPNWAQAAGNFAQGMMAEKRQPGIDAGMQRVNQRNVDARKQYLDILMRALRARQLQQPPPQTMEPTMEYGGPGNY